MDDTAILAENMDTLGQLHKWTNTFMSHHGLTINTTKTFFTGRDENGEGVRATIPWNDYVTKKRYYIKPSPENEATRYLGVHMALDLNWTVQTKKLETTIRALCAKLRFKQITALQGAMALKQIIIPRLDLSFRHIHVDESTLGKWDKDIADAFLSNMDLKYRSIGEWAVYPILKSLPITSAYRLTKCVHMVTTLVGQHEMTPTYTKNYENRCKEIDYHWEKTEEAKKWKAQKKDAPSPKEQLKKKSI